MMKERKFKIAITKGQQAIIQHRSNYDEWLLFSSKKEAIAFKMNEYRKCGFNDVELLLDLKKSIKSYSWDQVVDAYINGEEWPLRCGIVVEE